VDKKKDRMILLFWTWHQLCNKTNRLSVKIIISKGDKMKQRLIYIAVIVFFICAADSKTITFSVTGFSAVGYAYDPSKEILTKDSNSTQPTSGLNIDAPNVSISPSENVFSNMLGDTADSCEVNMAHASYEGRSTQKADRPTCL
jgi:hypothetical protein